jgi:hypothetical protein
MAESREPSVPPAHVLQCPVCGELLHAEGEDRYAYCQYCEAALKLAQGASGRLLAESVAVQMAASGDVLRLEYESAWSELTQLLRERQSLRDRIEADKATYETRWDLRLAGVGAVVAVVLLVAAALMGNPSLVPLAIAAYLVGRGAFYVVRGITESRKHGVEQRLEPELKEISARIRRIETRLEDIEDQLAARRANSDGND